MKSVVKETADVLLINMSTLAISFTQIENALKLSLLVLSIIYTIMKIMNTKKDNNG